jgi:hypothetical protein
MDFLSKQTKNKGMRAHSWGDNLGLLREFYKLRAEIVIFSGKFDGSYPVAVRMYFGWTTE